jgi:hypothetical protein
MPTPNGAQPAAPKGNTTIKYDNKGNRIPWVNLQNSQMGLN